jgi:hypothetical protein
MPQSLGSLGAQVGTGIKLVRAALICFWLDDAEEIWVEAAAPVRTRTTTKARTMFFIFGNTL